MTRLFEFVGYGDRLRHVPRMCNRVEPLHLMGEAEQDWPVCPDCLLAVQGEVRREIAPSTIPPSQRRTDAPRPAREPVRCDACGAWVFPGQPCKTCGGISITAAIT